MNIESGEIQMFVGQAVEEISSINKEPKEVRGRNPVDFAVIRFSGVYIPRIIEDIPSVVFGRDSDQYALTSVKNGAATFMDTTMTLYMYVTAGKSPKDQAIYVWFPFSQPAYPVDIFLGVSEIGEKIVRYAQRVNPDYPFVVAAYIPGFLKLQREVDAAEQRAIQKFRAAKE
jgi:hypothetical protein